MLKELLGRIARRRTRAGAAAPGGPPVTGHAFEPEPSGLGLDEVHEFWRMQLLDDLHRKLEAIEWEPALDKTGRRRAALRALIVRFEEIETDELHGRER